MENENRRNQKKNIRREGRAERVERTVDEGLVIGRNAVRELLRSGRDIDKILVQRGEREGSIVVLVAEAVARHIPVIETEKGKLDTLSGFAVHQGIIAMAAEKEYCTVDKCHPNDLGFSLLSENLIREMQKYV